eukprot:11194860-Prorocentrum_lima.AAC.1
MFHPQTLDHSTKVPQFLSSTCSTYYDIEAGREPGAAYLEGKGKGKSGQQQRQNPIVSDGNPMAWSTC